MKVYYIGTICSSETYNDIANKSKVKPSISAQVFEDSILSGLSKISKLEISAHTFLTIASFPNGSRLFIRAKKEKLGSGIITKHYPTINFLFLKHWGYAIATFFSLLKWLLKNRKDSNKVILCCSIFSFIARPVIFLSKLFKTETCVIVTDLPKFHFSLRKPTGLKKILSKHFLNSQQKIQSKFDKYILLTKYMKKELDILEKPSIIIEGTVNEKMLLVNKKYENVIKSKAIMYAGMLNRKHKIEMLIKGFMATKIDCELWLFGTGDFEKEIIKYSKIDDRIKFFGLVDREKVLEFEHKASLLINIRDSKEEYTKYSFPSKTIEYMSSGTPLLTTKLPGIPEEYFNYVYVLDNETEEGLSKKIEEIFSLSENNLIELGKEAMDFVLNEKNSKVQGKKIFEFLNVKR
ncbi:MAG: glycosyltransferase [[Clostridium] spiroforme]|uniref:Glycosyltransferase n=1 Tax=Thomasclavelia spiroformis TaxID=29348 RepID=A0A943I3R3_9FIRM|nr:glycosyltransferase [Thomasclavelia spiroformis]MBS5588773.1 glycosyltransferase [Thomasclavelia spiroformis]